MERWSIDLHKQNFKFSAAHFLIFPDGSAERLHGHNYRVFVEIDAALSRHGLVIDFGRVKPLVRQMVDELDEHWIVPGEHAVLRVAPLPDGHVEVRYQDRRYTAPAGDVLVLPINNVSAENLATHLGRELRRRLQAAFDDVVVHSLRLAVEETAGQRGVYHFTREPG